MLVVLLSIAVGLVTIILAYFGPMALYKTMYRDLRALGRYLRLLHWLRTARKANLSVPDAFDNTTEKHPEKVAFHFEDQAWTFREVQLYSLRIANVFRGKVAKGDAVALLMENRVEYICVWLGLSRLGAVPALINTNLRNSSLLHCITTAQCMCVVVGVELETAVKEIETELAGVPVYVSGGGDTAVSLEGAVQLDLLQKDAAETIPEEQALVNFMDKMCYIYTSGTTGLPKAAVITHSRFLFAGVGMLTVVGITSKDIVYDPLPLYHTAGGNIGVGMTVYHGVTLVLRRKFSVSNYFPDCHKYGCTAAQYIGEICRYLLNSPESEADKQHKIRVMFGNGLRPQIWQQFQDRFNIPRVSEFYGSTEGNANIINMDGRVGAVGFLSVLLPSIYPCALLRVHPETSVPVRDASGRCIRCKPGEPGEFVGMIVANHAVRDFKGYANKEATKKKIIHDVFAKGDCAFLSGDMLVMDDEGYLYFKDRTGDTFRWKGENVSTAEVENALSEVVEGDVAVYGVEVPHTEGRAGMAAILAPLSGPPLPLPALTEAVTALPSYARPLFLRPVETMEMTGTYKLRKTSLQKEGFDLSIISSPMYFLHPREKSYVVFTQELYDSVLSGALRL